MTAGPAYIRGGVGSVAGIPSERRIGRLAIAIGLGSVAAVAIALALTAGLAQARSGHLARRGLPVSAQVTTCTGVASGTGITEKGFICRARFVLAGRTHVAVVGGTSQLLPTGSTVAAVADPADPTTLFLARSLSGAGDQNSSYLTAAALGCAALTGGIALMVTGRRHRRSPAAPLIPHPPRTLQP